jgi:alpha-amylase
MGPRQEMGDLLPKEEDGWQLATYGKDFAVWEKAS